MDCEAQVRYKPFPCTSSCEVGTPAPPCPPFPPSLCLGWRLGRGNLAPLPVQSLYPKESLRGRCHGNKSYKCQEGWSESPVPRTPLLRGWGCEPESRGQLALGGLILLDKQLGRTQVWTTHVVPQSSLAHKPVQKTKAKKNKKRSGERLVTDVLLYPHIPSGSSRTGTLGTKNKFVEWTHFKLWRTEMTKDASDHIKSQSHPPWRANINLLSLKNWYEKHLTQHTSHLSRVLHK